MAAKATKRKGRVTTWTIMLTSNTPHCQQNNTNGPNKSTEDRGQSGEKGAQDKSCSFVDTVALFDVVKKVNALPSPESKHYKKNEKQTQSPRLSFTVIAEKTSKLGPTPTDGIAYEDFEATKPNGV